MKAYIYPDFGVLQRTYEDGSSTEEFLNPEGFVLLDLITELQEEGFEVEVCN